MSAFGPKRTCATLVLGVKRTWAVAAQMSAFDPKRCRSAASGGLLPARTSQSIIVGADGQFDRLPTLAADLVRHGVAALAAFAPPTAVAAKSVTFIANELGP